MKKLIILFMLLANTVYADTIPGWLELDLSLQKWDCIYDKDFNDNFYETKIAFKYGAKYKWFKPYFFGNLKTQFIHGNELLQNFPFRDSYTVGTGVKFFDLLYIEAAHTCSHKVISSSASIIKDDSKLYDSFKQYTHNHFKIGLSFKID